VLISPPLVNADANNIPPTSHVGDPYKALMALLPNNLVMKPAVIPLAFIADNPIELARRVIAIGQACLLREDFVEAHCWFLFALALQAGMNNQKEQAKLAITIARMWHQSGRLQEAASVLRSYCYGMNFSKDTEADLLGILDHSQHERLLAWARADIKGYPLKIFNGNVQHAISALQRYFIQDNSSWQASHELENTRAKSALSLGGLFAQIHSVMPYTANKYGIRGILDDTPHSDAMQRQWQKHGNFNYPEQVKCNSLYMSSMMHQQDFPPGSLTNIFEGKEQKDTTPLFVLSLYSKPSICLPFCKFVSVHALLHMESLLPYEMMPESSFVSRVHFAVSHRWQSPDHPDQDGSTLRRLKTILRNVEGISLDDGVFIDYCCLPCLPQGRNDDKEAACRLITLSSMDQLYKNVHVIFIPSGDYFLRSWCWHEYVCWLLSTRPTQALGDHMPAMHSAVNLELAPFLFGRPAYLLDRAELWNLEECWSSYTKTSVAEDKHLIHAMSARRIQEPCQNATSLLESLTRIVWKYETVLNISTDEEESIYNTA
jgi:hypothetical protein